MPGGTSRGGHAFYKQEELIISLSGSFDVVITDENYNTKTITLNRPYYGLFISPKTWRHIENFSTNALALHISNKKYSNQDYIRDFDLFKSIKKNESDNI